jgi:hypothetical protein
MFELIFSSFKFFDEFFIAEKFTKIIKRMKNISKTTKDRMNLYLNVI